MKKILFSSLFLWMVCMANAQTEPATFNILITDLTSKK